MSFLAKLFFFVPFIFLPAIVSAEYVPLSYCLPYDQPVTVANDKDHTCYLCPGDGMTVVKIKWDLGKITPLSDLSYCSVSISRPKKLIILGGFRESATEDSLVTGDVKYKENRLKSKDSALIRIEDLKVGDKVSVSCLGKEGSRASNKFVFHGCPPDCEVSFGQIMKSLTSNSVAHISETDFKSWGEDNEVDFVGYPDYNSPGSGDEDDIQITLGNRQDTFHKKITEFTDIMKNNMGYCFSDFLRCFNLLAKFNLESVDFNNIKGTLKKYLTKGNPVGLNYAFALKTVESGKSYIFIAGGGHAVVGYGLKDKTYPNFEVEVLDPNGPSKDILSCSREKFTWFTIPRTNKEVFLSSCTSKNIKDIGEIFKKGYMDALRDSKGSEKFLEFIEKSEPIAILMGGHSLIQDSKLGEREDLLLSARNQFCLNNPAVSLCKKTPVDRIKNDYPKFNNGSLPDGSVSEGYCYAWSDLVLRVAYLGNFSSVDYHPSDGNKVGTNCDSNHQPIVDSAAPTAQLLQNNLMASVINFFKIPILKF